jgi:hypothetical protein
MRIDVSHIHHSTNVQLPGWGPYQIRIRVRVNQHQHKRAAGRRVLKDTQLLVNYLGLLLCHPSGNPLALEVSTGISIQPRQLRHPIIESLHKVSQCHTVAIGRVLESYLHPSQVLFALALKLVQIDPELYRNAVHCGIGWERRLDFRVVLTAHETQTRRELGLGQSQ